jgi:tetratricopeptide (TPR) repeat protein
VTGQDKPYAGTLYARATKLYDAGKWSEAEAVFFQIGRAMPTASLAWLGAARAAFRQARYEIAATALEWALHAVPIRDSPGMRAGLAELERQNWAAAETAFTLVIEQFPDDSPAYMFLATTGIKLGRAVDAAECLEKAHKLEVAGADSI